MPERDVKEPRTHMRASPTSPRRLLFVDVLRLIAAVQMIQGHSIAAVLAPSYREGPVFQTWTFARGLTSVIFLFSAGFAFALAEARGSLPRARRGRVLRALRLLLIGYALHAPFVALLGAPLQEALRAWAAVDVLQCIAVSLLSLELLSSLVRESRARIALGLSLGLLLFALAPASQQLAPEGPALALGSYLTSTRGSLFPLVPWAGYVCIGFGLGTVALHRPDKEASWLALVGVLLLVLSPLASWCWPLGMRAFSPGYALLKLGCVLLLAAVLARLLRKRTRLPAALATLASETLFLYVSHVLLLYADHIGLVALLGTDHTPTFAVLVALALLVVSCGGALMVGALRARSASGTRAAPLP